MAQRLAGESTNTKFDSERPEKEITTTTVGDKTYLDVSAKLITGDSNIGVQYPLPTDGDSVYCKDIDVVRSDLEDFSGDACDLFNDLFTEVVNETTDNPKALKIIFNRTIESHAIGIECLSSVSNFSNVLIKLIDGSGNVRKTIDDSGNSTKYKSFDYKFEPEKFDGFILEFHTADEVCITNMVVKKSVNVVSRIEALDQESGTINPIDCHLSVDGGFHLATSIIQDIFVDDNNSSTINLTSANSYSFIGEANMTTAVSSIEYLLKTDQNATVYVEQSSDGTNWDETDSYIYYYSKGGQNRTIKTIGKYYRIRVILTGTTDTTYFRLTSRLVPISEPLPRSLDNYGRLKTASCVVDCETGKRAEVEPLGSLKVVSPVRLIGTPFHNGTKDPNFWTESITGTGTVAQAGQITLSTGTTANSSASYNSVRKARKVTGTTNQFRFVGRLVTDPQLNNVRRLGCYDDDNGFFFQINGLTFGIGSRKAGVDTIVTDGNFNGNYGADVTVDTTLYKFVIEYTSLSAKFFIDNVLLHTITSPTDSILNSLDLFIRMENYNINGNTTDNSYQIRFATILRLGELLTNGTYKYISGGATNVLKYGSGTLQRIVNNNNAGSLLVYDNIVASGNLIASIDLIKVLGTQTFNAPFSNGLTIVTSGSAKITVIYE